MAYSWLWAGLAFFVTVLLLLTAVGRGAAKIVWRLVIRVAFGALAIYVLNLFGQVFELYIPINPITAFVAGALGLPGLASLIIIKMWILA